MIKVDIYLNLSTYGGSPRRSRDTPFIDYSKSLVMAKDKYTTILETQAKEMGGISSRQKTKKVDLKITKH
jgi:hypothetical protein